MSPLIASSLVNNAAVEKLCELRLPIEVHRAVVGLMAYWWALGIGDERLMAEFKRLGIPSHTEEQ